ncbi:MAG: hypothetical protein DMG61_03940, partial [Acidobacteria bacterium]
MGFEAFGRASICPEEMQHAASGESAAAEQGRRVAPICMVETQHSASLPGKLFMRLVRLME